MSQTSPSVNGIPIYLTEERWAHIVTGHPEIAGLQQQILDTVKTPSEIRAGSEGALLAINEMTPGKFLIVVYAEKAINGFIITAYLTTRVSALNKRTKIWP